MKAGRQTGIAMIKKIVIFLLTSAWMFSGFPRIFNFPPGLHEAKADQVTLQADATSTPDNWTLEAGANKVAAVNAPDDDATSYVSSTGTSGTTQRYSVANHSIPSGATINFVRLRSRCMKGQSAAGTFIMSAVLSGNVSDGATKTSGTGYSDFTDDFAARPGGGSWTLDDINNLEIQIRNAQTRAIFCTTFEVIVDYAPPQDSDSAVEAHGGGAQSDFDLDPLNDTAEEKFSVLKFQISDKATTDTLPTLIDQITIPITGTGGNASTDIAWAELWNDTSSAQVATAASITNSAITFGSTPDGSGTAALDTVANGETVRYTVNVYMKNSALTAVDGQTYIFGINDSNAGTDTSTSSSQMRADAGAVTNVTGTITVTHSRIVFTVQPPATAEINSDFDGDIAVSATDANNNVDKDFTENITLSAVKDSDKTPGSGTLSSTDAGGLTKTPANGTATWTDTKYTVAEVIDIKAVSATTYTAGIYSTPVDVIQSFAGGSGTEGDPWLIETWTHLDNVRKHLDKHFRLIADLSAIDADYGGIGNAFEPIGIIGEGEWDMESFTGVFDGNNHTISDLVIYKPARNKIGFIGQLNPGGKIMDLGLIDADVTAKVLIGALVGENQGEIINCYVIGTVVGTGNNVGGLVGHNPGGTISRCYTAGSVSTGTVGQRTYDVGGLVGTLEGGLIEYSYSTATAAGVGDLWDAGGLIGTAKNSGTVSRSFATGNVSTSGSYNAGGLVGYQEAAVIINCYATGSVSGVSYVGGFVGYMNHANAEVTNSYSTGKPTGSSDLGGLVGKFTFGAVNNSFYDRETSEQSDTGKGTPKYTVEMKDIDTFSVWDINGVVTDLNNGYPYMGWQADGSPTAVWYIFETPAGIDISGTTGLANDKTVKVAVNSSPAAETGTTSGGSWFVTGVTVASGATVTVWIDGEATSSAVTKYDGTGNITGMELNDGVVAIGSDNNASLTVSDLSQYDSSDNAHIIFTSSAGTLTVSSPRTLKILSGNTLTIGDTETLSTHHVTIAGTLAADGSSNIEVSGDWSNSATFTSGTSTVTLSGTGQSISGSTTFYNLTKEVTSTDTLTFEAAQTQTVSNSLILKGAADNLLSIRSSTTDTQALLTLEVGGAQDLDYLDVKDNNASGGQTLAAGPNSTDSTNNDNWTFKIVSVALRTYDDTADYTIWSIGSDKQTDTIYIMGLTEAVLVKNDGNVAQDFSLEATGSNWVLGSSTAENQCVLMGLFNADTAPAEGAYNVTYDLIDGTTRWASESAGDGNYEGLSSGYNVAVDAGKKLYIYLNTPSSVTSGLEETITVTVGAREHVME